MEKLFFFFDQAALFLSTNSTILYITLQTSIDIKKTLRHENNFSSIYNPRMIVVKECFDKNAKKLMKLKIHS